MRTTIVKNYMQKRAFFPELAKETVTATGQLLANGYAYVLGAALLGGASLGWVGSKLNAMGSQDEDTVRKGYENERLKADINYLRTKLRQENDEANRQKAPKAARILG